MSYASARGEGKDLDMARSHRVLGITRMADVKAMDKGPRERQNQAHVQ